jgi:hypothetical protein
MFFFLPPMEISDRRTDYDNNMFNERHCMKMLTKNAVSKVVLEYAVMKIYGYQATGTEWNTSSTRVMTTTC